MKRPIPMRYLEGIRVSIRQIGAAAFIRVVGVVIVLFVAVIIKVGLRDDPIVPVCVVDIIERI